MLCVHGYRKLNQLGMTVLNRIRDDVENGTEKEYFKKLEKTKKKMFVPDDGAPPFPSILVRSTIAKAVDSHLKFIIESFGEQMPHMLAELKNSPDVVVNRIFIPNGLYKDKADVFKDMMKRGIIHDRISLQWLYKLWDELHPNVVIKKWIPFAKCQDCADLLERIKVSKSKEELSAAKEQKLNHRMSVALTRQRMHARMSLADFFPDHVLSIMIDGMDNNKTVVPHQATPSKAVDSTGMEIVVLVIESDI